MQDAYATASEYEQKFEKLEKEFLEKVKANDEAIVARDRQIAELSAKVCALASLGCRWQHP